MKLVLAPDVPKYGSRICVEVEWRARGAACDAPGEPGWIARDYPNCDLLYGNPATREVTHFNFVHLQRDWFEHQRGYEHSNRRFNVHDFGFTYVLLPIPLREIARRGMGRILKVPSEAETVIADIEAKWKRENATQPAS